MQVPPQILLRDVPHPETVEPRVAAMVDRLEKFCDRITACRVVVEQPHHRKHEGNRYRVRIEVAVPGREIAVTREPPVDRSREDVRVALRDAFDAARRRVEDWVREVRGDVKAHAPATRARVVRIYPEEGYGFLRAADGHEVYFHRASVRDGSFEELKVGSAVAFTEETGEEGPQAAQVTRAFGPEPIAD